MEVQHECTLALLAAQDLIQAVECRNVSRVWYSIRVLLIASANISKLLWPDKKFEARGKELRELLSVPTDSPITARDFRNHFEHFDERLEAARE